MHLSQHFTLAEFEFSETAARHGVDNSCPRHLVQNLERLCRDILEPVRKHFGPVRVTSGYRCPDLNRRVGSKPTSHHTSARAADFIIVNGHRPLTVCDWIYQQDLPFDQLIHEFGRWTHVSVPLLETDAPKREVLTIDKHGTRSGLHEARP